MNDLDEVAEHVSPKFVSWVRLINYGCDIVFELFYELYQIFGSCFPLKDREIEGSDDSVDLTSVALDENVLPCQPWGLEAGLRNVLGTADIAHGYFVVINLRDVIGERIATDGKLVAIEDVLVLGENIADIDLHIFVPRLLDFRHSASH